MKFRLIRKRRKKRTDCFLIRLVYGEGRKDKHVTFHGSLEAAERRGRELVSSAEAGFDASRLTVGEYLDDWFEKHVRPRRASNTIDSYSYTIHKHLIPQLGRIRLQALEPTDVEDYLAGLRGPSYSTLRHHRNILSTCLKRALRDRLVLRNAASLATIPMKAKPGASTHNYWNAEEAQRALREAPAQGPLASALFAFAIDSGCRSGEILGLGWSALDLTKGRVRIDRQLLRGGAKPKWGATKNRQIRSIDLGPETIARLKALRTVQAAQKLASGPRYRDHGLVFTRPKDRFGDPLGEALLRRILTA
jgi:integrase